LRRNTLFFTNHLLAGYYIYEVNKLKVQREEILNCGKINTGYVRSAIPKLKNAL